MKNRTDAVQHVKLRLGRRGRFGFGLYRVSVGTAEFTAQSVFPRRPQRERFHEITYSVRELSSFTRLVHFVVGIVDSDPGLMVASERTSLVRARHDHRLNSLTLVSYYRGAIVRSAERQGWTRLNDLHSVTFRPGTTHGEASP